MVCYRAGVSKTGGVDMKEYFQLHKNDVFFMLLLGTLLFLSSDTTLPVRGHAGSVIAFTDFHFCQTFCSVPVPEFIDLFTFWWAHSSRFSLLHMVLARMDVGL